MHDHKKFVAELKPHLDKIVTDLENDRLHGLAIAYISSEDMADEEQVVPSILLFAKNGMIYRLLLSSVDELMHLTRIQITQDRYKDLKDESH